VTDDAGAQDTDTFEVEVDWDWVIVTVDCAGFTGEYPSLLVVDGRPAISYEDLTDADLNYVRADDALGLSWGDPVVVDSTERGTNSSMAIVNGRPAITYGVNNLKYVRASDIRGDAWGTPVTISTDDPCGTSLAVVDGRPAVFYVNHEFTGIDFDVYYKYVRSEDNNGSAWGPPITLDTVTGSHQNAQDSKLSLIVADGNPAVSYALGDGSPNVCYRRASDTTGSTWGSPYVIGFAFKNLAAMTVVDGRPAVLYYDLNLYYIRADDAAGSSWGTAETVSGDNIDWCDLAVVNGITVAAWQKHSGDYPLRLKRSDDATGNSWGEQDTVDDLDSYSQFAVAEVEGRIAIAYYDSGTDDLKYAICMH